jgi:hypothetical protein
VRNARAVIAVCLATHAPDPALLDRQLASLEAQAGVEWSLVRVDDGAAAGAWSAFERCYARVPAGAAHVAPCGQDDVWHPGKLAALRGARRLAQRARMSSLARSRSPAPLTLSIATTRPPWRYQIAKAPSDGEPSSCSSSHSRAGPTYSRPAQSLRSE